MTSLKQISSFGFVGVVATLVHVSVGLGLHEGVGMAPIWANLIAFNCALGVSFFGQTRLTFPDGPKDGGAFVRFAVVAVTGLCLNQLIVWLMTSVFGSAYWLALVVIIVTVPCVTFVLLKFWALRR